MEKEIASKNGRFSDFQGLVALTLTLYQVTLHTVIHHSSTSTYIPIFIKIEKRFCERTGVWADRHLRPTLLGRLGRADLKRIRTGKERERDDTLSGWEENHLRDVWCLKCNRFQNRWYNYNKICRDAMHVSEKTVITGWKCTDYKVDSVIRRSRPKKTDAQVAEKDYRDRNVRQ